MMADFAARKSSEKIPEPCKVTYRIAGPDDPIYSGGLRVTSRPASRPSSATSRTGTDGTSQQDLDESENQADSPEQAIRAEAQRRLRTTRMAAKGQTPPSTK